MNQRKRPFDVFVEEQTKRFDELMHLSRADRLKILQEDWAVLYEYRDKDPMKEMRASMESKRDVSVKNATARINFAAQNPDQKHLDELIRVETEKTSDQFFELVKTLDDIKQAVETIERQVPQTFATMQNARFLHDLRDGKYDPENDRKKINAYIETETENESTATDTDQTQPNHQSDPADAAAAAAPTETPTAPVETAPAAPAAPPATPATQNEPLPVLAA